MDDMRFGELTGKVDAIKENTDKIPDLCVQLATLKLRTDRLEPLVDKHEKTTQRAVGMAAVSGVLASAATWLFKNAQH